MLGARGSAFQKQQQEEAAAELAAAKKGGVFSRAKGLVSLGGAKKSKAGAKATKEIGVPLAGPGRALGNRWGAGGHAARGGPRPSEERGELRRERGEQRRQRRAARAAGDGLVLLQQHLDVAARLAA